MSIPSIPDSRFRRFRKGVAGAGMGVEVGIRHWEGKGEDDAQMVEEGDAFHLVQDVEDVEQMENELL